jgi:very-short-patch-repair endonuclease
MQSALEKRFGWTWLALKGPRLEREYRFEPTRKWRFDFAHPLTRIAIEIEGGVWIRGAHTRPVGFTSDCEKYNAATAAGWRIFRLTRDMLGIAHMRPIIALLNNLEYHEHRTPEDVPSPVIAQPQKATQPNRGRRASR